MAAIRTREVNKGTIKSLDRAAGLADRVRVAGVKTKDHSTGALGKNEESASAYASDRSVSAVESSVRGRGRVISGGGRKAKNLINSKRQIVDVKTKKNMARRASRGAGAKAPASLGAARNASYRRVVTGKRVKTAARANAAKKASQVRSAYKAQVRTRKAAQRTAKEAKRSAALVFRALRQAIAGTKALVGLIVAGGWISLIIILVFTLFGAAYYFFGDESSSNYTPVSPEVEAYTPVIEKYAQQYGIPEYVELIKAVMMQESGGKGKDPMQAAEGAFNKKYPKKPNGIKDPDYSI